MFDAFASGWNIIVRKKTLEEQKYNLRKVANFPGTGPFQEIDETKRQRLIRQADDIMEQDPTPLPVAYEKMNDAWYNYVKDQSPTGFFGIYDVVRRDTVWLDK